MIPLDNPLDTLGRSDTRLRLHPVLFLPSRKDLPGLYANLLQKTTTDGYLLTGKWYLWHTGIDHSEYNCLDDHLSTAPTTELTVSSGNPRTRAAPVACSSSTGVCRCNVRVVDTRAMTQRRHACVAVSCYPPPPSLHSPAPLSPILFRRRTRLSTEFGVKMMG